MLNKIKSLFGGGPTEPCKTCEGSGQAVCHHCGGSGLLSIPNRTVDCHYCNKGGRISCPACHGKGQVRVKH